MTGGEVVVLVGELGTGKTTFIRGMALGMEVADPGAVRSPSYTLVIRYPGRRPLLHMDAYFMKSLEDLDLCTMEDALERRETVAIEWGDRVAERLPDHAIIVRIEHLGPTRRRIRIARETGPLERGD
jgi:tRNA threonylcarbamoyladenosine biosynthesis protein TsaE